MLPDFPAVKNHVRRGFIRAVKARVIVHEPILSQVRHTRIHEGAVARLTREDAGFERMEYVEARAELGMPREQMRSVTAEQLLEYAGRMGEQFAAQQVQLMFTKVSEAVQRTGNVVSASSLGDKDAFLDLHRRLQIDFDPETLEPTGLTIVLSPDMVDTFQARMAEWSEDPEFVSEMQAVRQEKIEEWRAREDCRKLVD